MKAFKSILTFGLIVLGIAYNSLAKNVTVRNRSSKTKTFSWAYFDLKSNKYIWAPQKQILVGTAFTLKLPDRFKINIQSDGASLILTPTEVSALTRIILTDTGIEKK